MVEPSARLADCSKFQCSSASRKFLNTASFDPYDYNNQFQCSSASRKFLNWSWSCEVLRVGPVSVLFSEPKIPQFFVRICICENELSFSALQRAENSSIVIAPLSVQSQGYVSVLFSEPKIPQSYDIIKKHTAATRFSALQRAENSSILTGLYKPAWTGKFQCSSASRKFLNKLA